METGHMLERSEQDQHTTIEAAAVEVRGLVGPDTDLRSLELAVRDQYQKLDGSDDAKCVTDLVRSIAEKTGNLSPAVIATAVKTVIHFEDDTPNAFAALMELVEVGEILVDGELGTEEFDAVGQYVSQLQRARITGIDIGQLVKVLQIKSSIRGFELLTTISETLEQTPLTPDQLFKLGVISSEEYEEIKAYLEMVAEAEAEEVSGNESEVDDENSIIDLDKDDEDDEDEIEILF